VNAQAPSFLNGWRGPFVYQGRSCSFHVPATPLRRNALERPGFAEKLSSGLTSNARCPSWVRKKPHTILGWRLENWTGRDAGPPSAQATLAALSQHSELCRAGRYCVDLLGQFARALDRLASCRGDHVPAFQAGLGGRTVLLDADDYGAAGIVHGKALGDVRGDRLNLGADPSARDAALVLELGNHRLYRIGRNSESDARRACPRVKGSCC
jgi:hypothetical protein